MKIIIFLLFISFQIFAGSIKDKAEDTIKKANPAANLKFEKYILPNKIKSEIEVLTNQKFFGEFIYIWKIIESDSLKKLVLLDNVYGKTMPITFMVEFDLAGRIIKSEIVKYREDHGGEVASERWNRQFIGKDQSADFKIGADIDGITGATISSRSVTIGVKKLSILVKSLILNELFVDNE